MAAFIPNPSGQWRRVRARPRVYAEGRELVSMQVPRRTIAENGMRSFRPQVNHGDPRYHTSFAGERFELSMVLFEHDRGNNLEYVAVIQVWASCNTTARGGGMGLSYTFNDDNIQVAVVDPNVEIDIVFVVGYGLVTDFPLQRITEAGLG